MCGLKRLWKALTEVQIFLQRIAINILVNNIVRLMSLSEQSTTNYAQETGHFDETDWKIIKTYLIAKGQQI